MINLQIPSPIQELKDSHFESKGIRVFVKRDDLIHPIVSGNKWRKLKYNLQKAKEEDYSTVLSFGGAYSNHIHALATAARASGLKSIGIIRGEELAGKLNSTLQDAQNEGMELHFVTREIYKQKEEQTYIDELKTKYGPFYLIPEGGKSLLGAIGCGELLTELQEDFDYLLLACGTGTTMAGIISAVANSTKVVGFPVLKEGNFLKSEIELLVKQLNEKKEGHWHLETNYHFGGYGKTTKPLHQFIDAFESTFSIPLDPIYTGKLFFGAMDLINKNVFPEGSKILLIHTGGIQGKRSLPQ